MTRRHRTNPTRSRFTAALGVVVALLAVGLPASTTGANLTNTKAVTSSTTPVGDWCSVPGSSQFKNVYRLNDFTTVDAPETTQTSTRVRMLVLPVANVAEYAPVGGKETVPSAQPGQLGIRLWSCSDASAIPAGSIKATAWRGAYAQANLNWLTSPVTAGSLAGARLDPRGSLTSGPTQASTRAGNELRDLHRGKNTLGGVTADGTHEVTMRYSWLLTNGRNELPVNHQKAPACSGLSCAVTPALGGDGATFANSFSHDESAPAAGAVLGNSATYLANKYYADGGLWQTMKNQLQCRDRYWLFAWLPWSEFTDASGAACPRDNAVHQYEQRFVSKPVNVVPTPAFTLLQTPAGLLDAALEDKTGTAIQYVVIEWWGATAVTTDVVLPTDLAVEVFVKR